MGVSRRVLNWLFLALLPLLLGACASSSGGAYYKGDGPGLRTADEFVDAPDAQPKDEPIYKASIRPYRVFGKRYVPIKSRQYFVQSGVASWYGRHFQGKPTSTGEPYDMYAMTAAHPTLPLPSYVRVVNKVNDRSVIVRVNDRGPFLNNRIIDLSYAAAAKLGYVNNGITAVDIEVVDPVVVAKNQKPGRRKALALAEQLRALEKKAATSGSGRSIGPVTQATIGRSQNLPNVQVASITPAGTQIPADTGFVIRFETVEGAPARPALRERKGGPKVASKAPVRKPEKARGPPLIKTPEPSVFLQLGAYGTHQTASQAALNLSEQFIWMAVDMAVVRELGLHKLQAGPFRDAADARLAANRIRKESQLVPFYVIR